MSCTACRKQSSGTILSSIYRLVKFSLLPSETEDCLEKCPWTYHSRHVENFVPNLELKLQCEHHVWRIFFWACHAHMLISFGHAVFQDSHFFPALLNCLQCHFASNTPTQEHELPFLELKLSCCSSQEDLCQCPHAYRFTTRNYLA